MDERVLTLHPEPGKSGVNIARDKYDLVRWATVESMGDEGEITFRDLMVAVAQRLEGRFEGSVSWYVTTVKLDLEARGVIERIPRKRLQHLRLIQPGGGSG